ncbi:DNA replication factor Cdt1 [Histomonas meleagridis]|uniref:DNA replication factor Cdt1 n=1 Tax=Histomonas meleagridis TaxID=135588 RepID=UPI00355A13A6|nr:DNA replication factor Cdt1 [Histomonas meleagridis]KAH0796632.1 DNA replication factor Cdt1 [Histomonas meleagridis]
MKKQKREPIHRLAPISKIKPLSVTTNIDDLDADQKFGFLLNTTETIPKSNVSFPPLPLPKKLEVLRNQTNSMISALTMLRLRKQVTTFSRVREIVERETKHSYTQQTLGRSLRVLPENTVIPEWKEDRRRNLPHQLYLNFVSNKKIDEILGFVYNELVEHVKIYHHKFLISIKEKAPAQIYQWHHHFQLDSVPDIKPIEISPPQTQQQYNVFDALKPLVEKRVSISAVQCPSTQSIIANEVPKSCANLNSYFAVAKMVQEKAQKLNALSEIASYRGNEDLLKLADVMNITFTTQKKKTLPVQDIINTARKNPAFQKMDNTQINNLVNDLISKCNGYFSRHLISNREYIKIDGQKTFQSIRGNLYHAIYEIV